jgi:hypothetical protein
MMPQWLCGADPHLGGLFHQSAESRWRVIVEELVHLRVPNHSTLFKSMLRAYLAQV